MIIPETFNQLVAFGRGYHDRSCHTCGASGGPLGARILRYSPRRYICRGCALARGDELLPHFARNQSGSVPA